MAKKHVRWQHIVPQREPHEIVPITSYKVWVCATCNKKIKAVDKNEGPEGLKALFRF